VDIEEAVVVHNAESFVVTRVDDDDDDNDVDVDDDECEDTSTISLLLLLQHINL